VTKINVCPAILRKLRENSGFSVEELARKLDVSVEKIIKVEEGRDSLTLTQIKNLLISTKFLWLPSFQKIYLISPLCQIID